MALQVWLPLNGDLRNQGLDGSGFFTNNSAVWGTGKIGSKAYLTSTGTNIATFSSLVGAKEFSIAYWLKIDSSLTFSNYQDFWQVYYTNKTGTGPIRDEHTNTAGGHQFEIYKETNVGSNTNGYYGIGLSTSASNIWTHIVFTKDNTQSKLYLNGVLRNTINNTDYESSTGSLTGDVRIGNATCGGYLNDFRIYDHALSLKEVKEIAKGLVLHYPLNKPQANMAKGGNTYDLNLNSWIFSNQNGGTIRTLEYDEYGTPCVRLTRDNVAQSGWSYFHYDRIENAKIKINTTYTISFDIKASVSGTVGMSGFMHGNATNQLSNSNSNIQNSIIANKWNHIILQTTTKSDFSGLATTGQVIYMSLSGNFRNTGATMLLKNIKLEEGNKETPWIPNESDPLYSALGYDSNIEPDCSGYKRDGIITGTLSAAADTPRYRTSYHFPSGANYINAGRGAMVTDAITVNTWIKYSTWETPISCTEGGGWNFENYNGGIRFPIYTTDNTYRIAQTSITPSSLANNWHMLTGTYDGENVKIYIDGKEEGKLAASTSHKDIKYNVNNVIFIGAEAGGNATTPASTAFIGNISDVRVYCTALSEEDIKALYEDAGYVDKNGNFYAYEFVEE